ncbi:torsin-1A-interacting protein 2 isoform X2 [Etheostoma spectabile]|uniref:torsin-1A-interacting protein 2 isoform X2 n=1 Tax=Etheostoma spectabile TaxID=54343 RepID=UPI0013AFC55F|nr:torsin-1A-interacting protein 2 isoform X2 [Etheostoma spectabile]
MAEQDPDHHHTTECIDESSSEIKQWETGLSPNEEQQLSVDSASSSASTNRETHNDGEDVEQSNVQIITARKVNENSASLNEGGHGDYRRETPGNEPSTLPAEEIPSKEEGPQFTHIAHASSSEIKQWETGLSPKEEQQLSVDSASSSASTNRETHNDGEDVEQSNVQNGDAAETKTVPLPEGSSPSDEETAWEVKEISASLNEGGHGDYRRETTGNEPSTTPAEEIPRENHTGGEEEKAPETSSPPALGVRKDDQVNRHNEETQGPNNTEAGEDDGSSPKEDLQDNNFPKRKENVPTAQDSTDAQHAVSGAIGNQGGSRIYLILGTLGVVVALLASHLQPESPPQKEDLQQIDIFLRQLEKVKTKFPNQRAELWNRSKIHLLRHLQSAQPTEPVSLILTAGHRAETTLRCLAQGLASAFSSALNASVLHIDGASKAGQDSDQVKLDIDRKLQGAFEGDKPVAVIDRFEELPPGSTLIFYRYCDHENAAYKKTCLIFTVLLGDEEEIPAETRLSTVEEMVDDHLQKKFLSDGRPVSFDRMDLDKYGGLWSRISHLILPVAVEERIENEGCKDFNAHSCWNF